MAGGGDRGRGSQRSGGSRIWQRVRSSFLTGLVVVAPVVITIYLTWTIVVLVDEQVLPLVPTAYNPATYIQVNIPGMGLVVFLVFTSLVGYFARKVFGRQLIRFGEDVVDRLPVIRTIYNAVKQISETIFSQSKSSFQDACLVEYPRKGIWAIAFVSTETSGELPGKAGCAEMVSVFLPTTPNPTSGFLLFVPKKDVVLLDMTVEEAAKLVISAGLVVPPTKEEREAMVHQAQARRVAQAKVAADPDGDGMVE